MTQDEYEAIVGNEPTLRDTLATVQAELDRLTPNVVAIQGRRDELLAALKEIDEAKAAHRAPPQPAQEEFAVPELSVTEPAKEDEDHGQS